jgi:stringent starvation protein B
VVELAMTNDAVSFNGRFGGVAMDVYVPVGAVVGIYARENGQGMVFDVEEGPPEPDPGGGEPGAPDDAGGGGRSGGKPALKVVK